MILCCQATGIVGIVAIGAWAVQHSYVLIIGPYESFTIAGWSGVQLSRCMMPQSRADGYILGMRLSIIFGPTSNYC